MNNDTIHSSSITSTALLDAEAFINASLATIHQARRYVYIRSALLDKSLFAQPEILEALSAFVRQSRYCEIHVLIDFPERILSLGHPLIELQRRLTQKIIIKTFYDEKDEHIDSLIINDQSSFLRKPSRSDEAGFFCSDGVKTQQQRELFQHAWRQSDISHHLRPINL